MNDDARQDAGAGALPWSSLLDPVANAKALSDVQARGLRAAGELVERLVRSVDGERTAEAAPPAAEGTEPGAAPSGDASRLLEVWIDLLRRTADSFGRLTDRPASGPAGHASAAMDVGTGAATGRVRLVVSPAGEGQGAELWVHNGTAVGLGPIGFRAGELRSPAGDPLDAAITFTPAQLPEVPARSSRGIAVGLVGDGALSLGTYRALVQVEGAPDLWLALEVVVEVP